VERLPHIINLPSFDTYALLGLADVCVTVGNSTTGIEALVMGKPLIEIPLPEQTYSYVGEGVAEPADGFDDLPTIIESLFAQGRSPERQRKVQSYLARHFTYQDDRAVDRVVEMAAEMLRARSDTSRPPLVAAGSARFAASLIVPVDSAPLEPLLATLSGIATHVPAHLFEVVLVNATNSKKARDLLASLGGDVRVIAGEPGWSFAECCNRAATEAEGEYLAFLKPGMVPCPGWLEGLLGTAEAQTDLGALGGRVCDRNGLLLHTGLAFDVNQSAFPLYRFLPPDFPGAQKRRDFQAVPLPFLVPRERFCALGGFSPDLTNRFEDVDFCLRARQAGLRVLYTPESVLMQTTESWTPAPARDQHNRMRFYARWTGSLWQDDERYLAEDGLSHDTLSALYRDFAGRVSAGARAAEAATQP